MSKAKPKAKRTPRASPALEPASASRAAPKPGAKASSRAGAPKRTAKAPDAAGRASRLNDQRTRDLGDGRGETLARMRALILRADPEMTEEWDRSSSQTAIAPRLGRGG
jgi:hypothetical protein